MELKIEYKPINELKLYKKNPRKNDRAVEIVKKSIQEFGFKVPILIDENNEIIAGHTRIKAAKELELTEVPTIKITDLTPEQIRAFRIMDNRSQEFSSWDYDLLKEELNFLKEANFDIDLTGFDISDTSETIYTKKIERPVYIPSKTKPRIEELCDTTKRDELVEEIKNLNLKDKREEQFLIETAQRFIKFNYSKIADYYAHSDKEVQEIMEKLALVIIDFNKAIEEGFVKLTQAIAGTFEDDEE